MVFIVPAGHLPGCFKFLYDFKATLRGAAGLASASGSALGGSRRTPGHACRYRRFASLDTVATARGMAAVEEDGGRART
jgi:hypothetical protein